MIFHSQQKLKPGESAGFVGLTRWHLVEHCNQLPRHLCHIGHAVHRVQQTLRRVVRQDRRGLPVIGLQPSHNGLAVIVSAADKFVAAAFVAHAGHSRLMEAIVIPRTAFGAGEAAGDPFNERAVIDLQFNDRVERHLLAGQHRIQGNRLRNRARKAVQNEPSGAIWLLNAPGKHADHDVVRHQATGFHDRLRLQANLAAGLQFGTQHVPGRDLRNAIAFLQDLGLGSLARAWRAQKYELKRPRPFTRAFLIMPSYWCANR